MLRIPAVVVGEYVVINHSHIIASCGSRLSVLRASVRSLDWVEEAVVVHPPAVHCHCGLELECPVELDCGVTGEKETVSLVVVVLGAGEVL